MNWNPRGAKRDAPLQFIRAVAQAVIELTSMIARSVVKTCIHRLVFVGLERFCQMMLLGSGAASMCSLERLHEDCETQSKHQFVSPCCFH